MTDEDYTPFPESELQELSEWLFETRRPTWGKVVADAVLAHTAMRERMLIAELRLSLVESTMSDGITPRVRAD